MVKVMLGPSNAPAGTSSVRPASGSSIVPPSLEITLVTVTPAPSGLTRNSPCAAAAVPKGPEPVADVYWGPSVGESAEPGRVGSPEQAARPNATTSAAGA